MVEAEVLADQRVVVESLAPQSDRERLAGVYATLLRGVARARTMIAAVATVESQEQLATVSDIALRAAQAKGAAKKLEQALEAPHVAEYTHAIERVRGATRPILAAFAAVEDEAKRKAGAFFDAQARAKEQEQREAAERLAEARRKEEAAAKAAAAAPTSVVADIHLQTAVDDRKEAQKEAAAAAPITAARTERGTLSSRERFDCAIEDEALVPREFCKPSLALIRKAVAAGARSIPGVRITPSRQLVGRPKKRKP